MTPEASIQRSEGNVLIVDDDKEALGILEQALAAQGGIRVITAQSGQAGLARMKEERVDLLITNVRMEAMDGMALLRQALKNHPKLQVFMITGYPDLDQAVDCMKMGASDFFAKPLDLPEFCLRVQGVLQDDCLEFGRVGRGGKNATSASHPVDEKQILGQDGATRKLLATLDRAALADVDVLITGETGTGKELAALRIHHMGRRREGSFIPVNCAAIPEELMESQFFGHERGAFTGAHETRTGLLGRAHGGTLFLDEICELSMSLQAKLLRAIQERSFQRVGGQKEFNVDLRVISATNRNIDREVEAGRFREDLFYRLDVFRIHVPSLRERKNDIPLLCRHFLQIWNASEKPRILDPEAEALLLQYPWPGNVRQLQNVLRKVLAMNSDEVLRVEDFPANLRTPTPEATHRDMTFYEARGKKLKEFERLYFSDLLRRFDGEVAQATQAIDMPRATFYRFLQKHGLSSEGFRNGK